jgi:uncharacterized protein with NRDE domain
MCLIVLAYRAHPDFPLIVAANRDEFLDRPAEPARFWPAEPHVLAGRDHKAGGTWLGVTTGGRFAALTNYRDLRRPLVQGPSRGSLVRSALEDGFFPVGTEVYDGLNLLYGTVDELMYHNNITGETLPLVPGIHGLSNHLLNTPWPKVERAKRGMEQILGGASDMVEQLFQLLGDGTTASDELLPDTGLEMDRERALSSIHISLPNYGTRCSTVVLFSNEGSISFDERVSEPATRSSYSFDVGQRNKTEGFGVELAGRTTTNGIPGHKGQ